MKQLIMINGIKRSGKDYAAEIIQSILGKVDVVSFAAPLKQIIADTFEITREELEDYKNNDEGIYLNIPELDGYSQRKISDFRKVLQRFGTEAIKKQFGDDIWAEKGIKDVIKSKKKFIVITDFRMLSEYKKAIEQSEIHNFNVTTINIFNSDLPIADLHATERELSDNKFKFNYIINNTGQPKNIKEICERILSQIIDKTEN